MSRVGPGRRQIIRGNTNKCAVSYNCNDGIGEQLAEICLIFEMLECRYCLVRELRQCSLDDLVSSSTTYANGHSRVREAQSVMAETFKIVRRSGVHFLLEINDIRQTEQVAWLGILGNDGHVNFALHNPFVNSSLFSSSEI